MFTKIIKKSVLFIALVLFINPIFAETKPEQVSADGEISRALFTSAVQNREPIDQLDILSELISEAFFFTEFKNFQNRTLTHQWSHNGKISHSIPFIVKGKRWRVFSSKTFMASAKQEGTWTVKIIDESGDVLSENNINYIRPSTDAELEAALKEQESAPPITTKTDKDDAPELSETDDSNKGQNSPDSNEKSQSTSNAETESTKTEEIANPNKPVQDKKDSNTETPENSIDTKPVTAETETPKDEATSSIETENKKEDSETADKESTTPEDDKKDGEPPSSAEAPIWDKIK